MSAKLFIASAVMSEDFSSTRKHGEELDAELFHADCANAPPCPSRSNREKEFCEAGETVARNLQEVTALLCAVEMIQRIGDRQERFLEANGQVAVEASQKLAATQLAQPQLVISGLAAIGVQLNEETRAALAPFAATDESWISSEDLGPSAVTAIEAILENIARIDDSLIRHLGKSVEKLEALRDQVHKLEPERRAKAAANALLRRLGNKRNASY